VAWVPPRGKWLFFSHPAFNLARVQRYQITTPEQVAFHYTVAGPVARCMAWLTDQFLIWVGYAAILFAFAGLGQTFGNIFIVLGIFILDFSYFVYFELKMAGQSPGKRWFGIRVISARGTQLRFADVLIRNLMRPIDVLPFAMLLGGGICCIDRWHRRLGDMVADTIIIRDISKALPTAMATEKARVNTFAADAMIRARILTRVSRPQRDFILDLSIRRDQIDPAARQALFAQAATHFRSQLGLPENLDYLSDEQTIINLAMVIQDAKFTA
jgi:uncharacterized RDD family membrane protein YckC